MSNAQIKIVKIPKKKKGEFREICIPSLELKHQLRKRLFDLNKRAFYEFDKEVQGFVPSRSPVTNASVHIGYNFSLNFDLKDFFDSVTPEMVSEDLVDCFINGRAYQGLPTSPMIANFAAIPLDKEILKQINDYINSVSFYGEKEKIVYTRYADDMTFSFNHYETYNQLRRIIPQIVESKGFKINSRKIHLQTAKFGRRMITGIGVDKDGIHIPRAIKRKMRVAKHKQQFAKYYGLEEWSKLKKPNSCPLCFNDDIFKEVSEVNRVTKAIDKNKKYSTNYKNIVQPIEEYKNEVVLKTHKGLRNKDPKKTRIENYTPNKIKKGQKLRSKLAYMEIEHQRPGLSQIIKERIISEKSGKKFLIQKDLSDSLGNSQKNDCLVEDLLS